MTEYVKTPRQTVTRYEYLDLDGLTLLQAGNLLHELADIEPDTVLSFGAHNPYVGNEGLYAVRLRPETDGEMQGRHGNEAHTHNWNRARQLDEKAEYLRLKAKFEGAGA